MTSSSLERVARRDFLKLSAAGAGVAAASGWMEVLANYTAKAGLTGKTKSCILLWMDGGPSHKDTFDLKPGTKAAGEFMPIATSVPGIQISEHLPQLAKLMHHGAVVRGMSSPEGAHARAKYNLHTGYREGQGGLVYPSIGAIASQELGRAGAAVPNFVSIGNRTYGSGFIGPKHQPLIITDPNRGVEDLKTAVSESQFSNRMGLLQQMETAFHSEQRAGVITDHKTNYERAVTLMKSAESKAFDISAEPAAVRAKYAGSAPAGGGKDARANSGRFGDGVLMARRLVEVGVPFVEVSLGGWDTHQDCWNKVKANSMQVDAAVSSLILDLKDRGLLDTTLVIWMGEFGRTPNINSRGDKPGRDHYPKAWSLAMWGCGIKGTVVGKTDKEGATVEEGKQSPQDFLGTVCELLGIDHAKKNETPTGRPIQIVEKAKPFTKLLV